MHYLQNEPVSESSLQNLSFLFFEFVAFSENFDTYIFTFVFALENFCMRILCVPKLFALDLALCNDQAPVIEWSSKT